MTKRAKAVKIEPAASGLTVIGGKNGQGKTSVLDAIAWALGGDKFRPAQAQRDGSVLPPTLHVTMNNGLVVECKGKNSDLKVVDPGGQKGGQQLLSEFVEQLALDLSRDSRISCSCCSIWRHMRHSVRSRWICADRPEIFTSS